MNSSSGNGTVGRGVAVPGPVILCDLEGRPQAEVAGLLRCPEGTLSARLTRGRRMLADRLRSRGVGPAAGVALVLTSDATAPAESLIRQTVPVALAALVGPGGVVLPTVAQLATGVMQSMFLNKLRAAVAVVLGVAAVGVAASYVGWADPPPARTPGAAETARESAAPGIEIDVRLLKNRKVLKELRCDIDQYDQIMDILEDAEQKARMKNAEVMAKVRGGGDTPRSGAPRCGRRPRTPARRSSVRPRRVC